MAKIQFLTILLTATCFLGGVVSVTDKEFEELVAFVRQQAVLVEEESKTNERQSVIIDQQSAFIQQLQKENRVMAEKIDDLESRVKCQTEVLPVEENLVQNTTIEERVALLEIQVADIEGQITDLDQDVNFLFDEQVIQDERLFSLEQETDAIDTRLLIIDYDLDTVGNELEDLQNSIFSLDFRVTALEENGGGDGNSSVAELEVRVEILEETTADHETRISDVETDVSDLEEITNEHDTRLTAAEENIQGLQMTDVELDQRVTALEENGGGGGNNQNATIAFHAILTSTSSIPDESAILFNEVLLNEGDGYDSSTGTFTVPSGGDGYYYFSVFLVTTFGEFCHFEIQLNGEILCTAFSDQLETSLGEGETSCSAVTHVVEGDTVRVLHTEGTDTTPLWVTPSFYLNGFNGFRI